MLSLAATLSRGRRLSLALPAAALFLILWYELRTDRWEKTVTAPIRVDMFLEIPLMMIALIFGATACVRVGLLDRWRRQPSRGRVALATVEKNDGK